MNTGWRRMVNTIVATFVAASSVIVCAPASAAPGRHCHPARGDASNHCHPSQAMDCCATSAPQAPSVPEGTQPQQQNTRTSSSGFLAQSDLAAVLNGLQPPIVALVVRSAPLHGYRSTDLPTLNAVFLI